MQSAFISDYGEPRPDKSGPRPSCSDDVMDRADITIADTASLHDLPPGQGSVGHASLSDLSGVGKQTLSTYNSEPAFSFYGAHGTAFGEKKSAREERGGKHGAFTVRVKTPGPGSYNDYVEGEVEGRQLKTHTLRRDLLSTSHKVSRAHISPIADIPQKALDNRKHHPETPGPFLTQEHYKKGRLSTLPLSPVVKFTETKRAISDPKFRSRRQQWRDAEPGPAQYTWGEFEMKLGGKVFKARESTFGPKANSKVNSRATTAPAFGFGSEKHKEGRKYTGTLLVDKGEWRSHPEKNDKFLRTVRTKDSGVGLAHDLYYEGEGTTKTRVKGKFVQSRHRQAPSYTMRGPALQRSKLAASNM